MTIQEAKPDDLQAIQNAARRAFGEAQGEEISELIAALTADPTAEPMHHPIALVEDQVIGQALFTKAMVEGHEETTSARVLGPVSVDPDYQKQGVGSRLVREGLERLRGEGVQLVFVLGDPRYYGRFGFGSCRNTGLSAPHTLPESYGDAWQVLGLQPGSRVGAARGTVQVAKCFSDRKYWVE